MSAGAIFILFVVAMFPTLILVAFAVKMWEVRQASRWPSEPGKVVISKVKSHKKKPSEPGYNFSDTEVTNEPQVEYDFLVGGSKYRGTRITIGEKTSGFELESILARYPVGAEVTVYYDPANPKKAVLERDLPMGIMLAGMGCLLLFFIGGPLLALFFYFNGVKWFTSHLANPDQAPFVTAAGGFGLLVLLFAIAFGRMIKQASGWPVTTGHIVSSGVDAYLARNDVTDRRLRTSYKSSVVYQYQVNGREYTGGRLTMGVVISASFPGAANRTARRYPVGTEVQVHYNPQSPGESVLHPRSYWHYLLWLVAAVMFVLAWAVATGRM